MQTSTEITRTTVLLTHTHLSDCDTLHTGRHTQSDMTHTLINVRTRCENTELRLSQDCHCTHTVTDLLISHCCLGVFYTLITHDRQTETHISYKHTGKRVLFIFCHTHTSRYCDAHADTYVTLHICTAHRDSL